MVYRSIKTCNNYLQLGTKILPLDVTHPSNGAVWPFSYNGWMHKHVTIGFKVNKAHIVKKRRMCINTFLAGCILILHHFGGSWLLQVFKTSKCVEYPFLLPHTFGPPTCLYVASMYLTNSEVLNICSSQGTGKTEDTGHQQSTVNFKQ